MVMVCEGGKESILEPHRILLKVTGRLTRSQLQRIDETYYLLLTLQGLIISTFLRETRRYHICMRLLHRTWKLLVFLWKESVHLQSECSAALISSLYLLVGTWWITPNRCLDDYLIIRDPIEIVWPWPYPFTG